MEGLIFLQFNGGSIFLQFSGGSYFWQFNGGFLFLHFANLSEVLARSGLGRILYGLVSHVFLCPQGEV